MALADATVRVILDVSKFDRDLDAKVERAASRAGRAFSAAFAKTGEATARRWVKEFADQTRNSMTGAGLRAGHSFGINVRRAAVGTGRRTGVELGEQIRGGLLQTASLTGRQYGRGLLSGSITEAGNRIGQRIGGAINQGLSQGLAVNLTTMQLRQRLRQLIEDDATPGLLEAARTIAGRFGTALGAGLSTLSIGRVGFLVAGIGALVSEGIQLAAALAPALQAIGLIPSAALVATAGISSLVVAFQGMGDAFSAAASGDAEKLAEALENISPAARSVVQEFAALTPRMRELRLQVQQAFFRELTGDLQRLGDALLGPVQRGMTATASAAGRMASNLLEVLSSSRSAAAIEEIFNSAASAFDRLAGPLGRVTQGLLDWTRATLPAFDQLVATLGTAADRFATFLTSAASSGQAMAWVNEAVTTLSQLSRVAVSAGKLVTTIFDAANVAGGEYLLSLNNALIATRQFLAVGAGRQALIDTFEGIREVVAALAAPLRAAAIALGQISQVAGSVARALSSGVADAIEGIGQGLANAGPGLTRFAEVVGSTLSTIGEVLPDVGASLGRLLSAVAPLVQVIGVLAQAGSALLTVLTSLPGPVLTVIAAFVALRALGLPTLFQSITSRTTGMGGAFSNLASTYQANIASLTAMRIQQQVVNNAMSAGIPQVSAFGAAVGGLADRARAAGTAIGGPLAAGARNLFAALGGGVGVALAGAAFLISMWAEEQAKADRATAEHNARVQQLASTLDKATGSITAATRAQAQETFSQGQMGEAARRLGLSYSLVAEAATGSAASQRVLQESLRNSALDAIKAADKMGLLEQQATNLGVPVNTLVDAFLGNASAMDTVRKATEGTDARFDALSAIYEDVIGDQVRLGTEFNSTAEGLRKQADAIRDANAAFSPAQRLADSLADAMNTLASNSSSAADKTRALDSALRILAGGTLELSDAQRASADALTRGNDQIQQVIDKYALAGRTAAELGISTQEFAARQQDLGRALFDSSGQIDFASERARGLYDVSKDLRQATIDQTAAILDNAQKTGGDMTTAYQRARDVMAAAREQVIQWARALGYGQKDAEALANAMGLIPDNVRISMTMPDVPIILKQLAQIKGDIQVLPDRKSLRLDSNAAPMRSELERLGFAVEEIPGSKDIRIRPNTEQAGVALREFIEQQIVQRNPQLNIGGNIALGKMSAEELRAYIETMPADVTPQVEGGPARQQLDTLLATLLPPGTPTITPGVNLDPVQEELNKFLIPGFIPSGKPEITPGVNTDPAKGQIGTLLEDLLPPGQPEVTPGVNTDPAQRQLDQGFKVPLGVPLITPGMDLGPARNGLGQLTQPPPSGVPMITPGLNTAPARGSLGGFMEHINHTTSTGPIVNGNFGPATAQLAGLVTRINTTNGMVNVGANTGSAFGAVSGLIGWIGRNGTSVGVGADTRGAFAQVDALVRYINSRIATVTVRTTNPSVEVAEGAVFKYFHQGGFNPMRKMPANRAEIVPPRLMRVIGDRARGDEAFIPLVNSARSHAILRTAANRLGFEVTPSNQRPVNTRTTTIEAGAVVVNAPYSDPRLVAREVINELTREAVI